MRSFEHMRRRLQRFQRFYAHGLMTRDEITKRVVSWIGHSCPASGHVRASNTIVFGVSDAQTGRLKKIASDAARLAGEADQGIKIYAESPGPKTIHNENQRRSYEPWDRCRCGERPGNR